jgi:hypothetical protein
MSKQVVTTLPNGYWEGGALWRQAQLRELTGEDHLFLIEECQGLLPAQWTTEVIARCVVKLGPNAATRDAVRSLTVGDREALLLQLRRLTLGDKLKCILSCPLPDCGEKLELELDVASLLRPVNDAMATDHELSVSQANGRLMKVRFRLPAGNDQEAVALLALTDVDAAAELLMRRCILSTSENGDEVSELPASLVESLSARMAELDSQAEINLLATCEACGGSFSFVFDTAGYFFQELEAEFQRLYREVHLLAFHYHWGLSEIFSLSSRKRRKFLELLENELTEGTLQ